MLQAISKQSRMNSVARMAEQAHLLTIRGYLALTRARDRLRTRLTPVNLRSRRGEGGVLWSILAIAMVAGVAIVSIIVIGPKLKELGQNAANQVNQIPANWP